MRQFAGIRRRRISAVPGVGVAIASSALVLAACASGSATATATPGGTKPSPTVAALTATPTPSIDSFVAQANAICTSGGVAGDAVPTPGVSSGDLGTPTASELPGIATYFGTLIPILNTLASQLQGLGTPPSDESDWSAALAAFQTTVADFQTALTAAQGGDLSSYDAAIAQEATDNQGLDQAFNAFGATVCAGGGSTSPSPSATPTPS